MFLGHLYQAVRRFLPLRVKHVLKQVLRFRAAVPTAQIPLRLGSVEDALYIWSEESPLVEALQRVAHPDRRAPHASIIMLTHNKLSLTCLCLESLYRYTQYPHFELILVDNASEDGTQDYLEGLKSLLPNLHVVFNSRNEGFARGNNKGLMRSCGDYVVLLNNDTIVTPGWLTRLIGHLERDPKVGMVGPVTNSSGNEQRIQASYRSLEELEDFAQQRLREYGGRYFQIDMLGMFCVVFRRRLLDEVGLLDERFELGTFEDDDFCHRVRMLGYKLICAEDVFVHHFGKGTMRALGDKDYLAFFNSNRKRFEQKWGVRWRPHRLGRR